MLDYLSKIQQSEMNYKIKIKVLKSLKIKAFKQVILRNYRNKEIY